MDDRRRNQLQTILVKLTAQIVDLEEVKKDTSRAYSAQIKNYRERVYNIVQALQTGDDSHAHEEGFNSDPDSLN